MQHFGECSGPQNGSNEIPDSQDPISGLMSLSAQSLAGPEPTQHLQSLGAGQPSSCSWTQSEPACPFQTMTRNHG